MGMHMAFWQGITSPNLPRSCESNDVGAQLFDHVRLGLRRGGHFEAPVTAAAAGCSHLKGRGLLHRWFLHVVAVVVGRWSNDLGDRGRGAIRTAGGRNASVRRRLRSFNTKRAEVVAQAARFGKRCRVHRERKDIRVVMLKRRN
jgi:hypothetical protein